jgi:plasmid rolling circle replication initiator protein Rep
MVSDLCNLIKQAILDKFEDGYLADKEDVDVEIQNIGNEKYEITIYNITSVTDAEGIFYKDGEYDCGYSTLEDYKKSEKAKENALKESLINFVKNIVITQSLDVTKYSIVVNLY